MRRSWRGGTGWLAGRFPDGGVVDGSGLRPWIRRLLGTSAKATPFQSVRFAHFSIRSYGLLKKA
jgi:hypothetical protein